MKIGVVSDTHGHLPNAHAAALMLEQFDISAVLHCGDIGSPQIPACFSRWLAHYVLGNVDHYDGELYAAAVSAAGGTFHARFADLSLGGKRIAVLHSDDAKRFKQTIASGDYDLVCYGHTHVAEQHQEGKTLVLNPGALQRANPHQIAVVDLETMKVMHVKV